MYELPLQEVSLPLHLPFDWHFLVCEPIIMKPISQVNDTLFGKVVSRPLEEPFIGTDRGPQSFAIIQACRNSMSEWVDLSYSDLFAEMNHTNWLINAQGGAPIISFRLHFGVAWIFSSFYGDLKYTPQKSEISLGSRWYRFCALHHITFLFNWLDKGRFLFTHPWSRKLRWEETKKRRKSTYIKIITTRSTKF